MLPKHGFGVGFKKAVQAQRLVDFIQVVHEVVIPDDLAEVIAATSYQAVILAEPKSQAGGAEQGVGWVQNVGENAGATPGVEANAVGGVRAFTAGGAGYAGRGEAIELCAALRCQRLQAGAEILLVTAA